jgi:sigma-B regulation protein RsbU (phosphoserine phosphatase)
MSFSLLRIIDSKLLITSAGMPPVYYFNNEKKETEEILIQGMPLGAMKKFSYKLVEKELKSGDTLLLLTDGLPEQMNPNDEMFDYPRVKNHFNEIAHYAPDEIINNLVKSADEWMNGKPQADDITFIVIKVI